MPARRKSSTAKDSAAHLGFEVKLWLAAERHLFCSGATIKSVLMDCMIALPGQLFTVMGKCNVDFTA